MEKGEKINFLILIFDGLVKSRLTGPAAGTGVQCFCNILISLDSGFRLSACGHAQAGRNDDLCYFSTFYEFIKFG